MTKAMLCGVLALGVLASACGDEDETFVANAETPSGTGGTGGSGPTGVAGTGGTGEPSEPPCVENPVTHLDIINACTTAVKVKKTPALTLLNADGTLPPL